MDYFLIVFADILLAFNFAATKEYQKLEGISLRKGLRFNLLLGIISAIMFWGMQGFQMEISWFSLIMASAQAVLCVIYTIIGFRIMAEGKMAIYTVFLMTGGMSIPYVWGLLFLDEPFSWLRSLGLVMIVLAVVVTNSGEKRISAHQIRNCCLVFILNGFVSVVSKEHQIGSDAISTVGFCTINSIAKILICAAVILFLPKVKEDRCNAVQSNRTAILVVLAAVSSGLSYLCQLTGAKNLPATILYPLVTGGSIVCTALAGKFIFKENLNRQMIIGIALCIVGTCMFL